MVLLILNTFTIHKDCSTKQCSCKKISVLHVEFVKALYAGIDSREDSDIDI